MPPALIMFGTNDRLIEYGKLYIGKVRDLDLQAELLTADGQEHGFFNGPPWMNASLHVMELFLEKHGYLEGSPLREPEASAEMKLFRKVKR